MRVENNRTKPVESLTKEQGVADRPLHPARRAFTRFYAEMGHGEIESFKIQDGLPVI